MINIDHEIKNEVLEEEEEEEEEIHYVRTASKGL